MVSIKTIQGWEVLAGKAPPAVDREKSVLIGTSIWCFCNINNSKGRMLEYDNQTNKLLSVIQDSYDQMDCDACCAHKENIYLVKGQKADLKSKNNGGRISVFNTSTKTITKVVYTKCLRKVLSCIAMNDVIHIFNGCGKRNHFEYSIENNTLITFTDPVCDSAFVNVVTYENTLLRFSGTDYYIESDVLGKICGESPFIYKSNKTDVSSIRLQRFGCILYRGYAIIFGGEYVTRLSRKKTSIHPSNGICVWDIFNKSWRSLKYINCPVAAWYKATIDCKDNVVLSTDEGRYSINIQKLLRAEILVSGYMRIKIFDCSIVNRNTYPYPLNDIIADYVGIAFAQ